MNVVWLLRAEGLAVFAISIWLYAQLGSGWWLFFGLLLMPDVSMLPYLLNSKVGAASYNLAHNYVLPLGLVIVFHQLRRDDLMPYILIWTAHIGMDRMMGYGLKYATGFKSTHLATLNQS